jgi:hypothetical protein
VISRIAQLAPTLVLLASAAFAQQARPPEYQAMTAKDFIIDGPQLAARGTRVELTGVYVPEGGVPVLFADPQAANIALYVPSMPRPPSIALLTDDASRAFREALYNCSQMVQGCWLHVRGRATKCGLTNNFGATHESPCIDVEDGGPPPPRPPPPPLLPPGAQAQSNGAPRAASPPSNDRILQVIRDAGYPCDAITSVQTGGSFEGWKVLCGTNAYAVGDVGGGHLMAQPDKP